MSEYDMQEAIQKGKEFLGEFHNTTSLESSELKNGVWHLLFDVGFLSVHLKTVKVDASSGKIVEYTSMDATDDKVEN